jgi:cytochrome c-type biogenesis protein
VISKFTAPEKIKEEIPSAASESSRWRIFSHAAIFVLGFSLVFIIGWGGSATILGGLFGQYSSLLSKIGGVVVIAFGLHTLGILSIPFFDYDLRPDWSKNSKRKGYTASGLMGVFFAAGWTPCVGTILGAILTLGLNQATSGQAMLLASGYAIGLGIPFLAIGLGVDRASKILARYRNRMQIVQRISGIFLLLLGILIFTDQLAVLAIWAQKSGLYLSVPLAFTAAPSYLIAIAAGLISFVSPCVLPLVPAYLGYLSGHAVREMPVQSGIYS